MYSLNLWYSLAIPLIPIPIHSIGNQNPIYSNSIPIDRKMMHNHSPIPVRSRILGHSPIPLRSSILGVKSWVSETFPLFQSISTIKSTILETTMIKADQVEEIRVYGNGIHLFVADMEGRMAGARKICEGYLTAILIK